MGEIPARSAGSRGRRAWRDGQAGGSDYYTSTGVEVLDTSLENRRSLSATAGTPSRYTELVRLFCSRGPGSGWVMSPREHPRSVTRSAQRSGRRRHPGRRIAGRIIGREEWAAGTVTIRNMMTGNRHPPAPPTQWCSRWAPRAQQESCSVAGRAGLWSERSATNSPPAKLNAETGPLRSVRDDPAVNPGTVGHTAEM
jgi:hypothetical protein